MNESDQATSVLSQHLQDLEPGVLDARSMNHPGERCLELDAIGFSLSLGVLRFLHTLAEHSGVELVVLLCCCWQPPMLSYSCGSLGPLRLNSLECTYVARHINKSMLRVIVSRVSSSPMSPGIKTRTFRSNNTRLKGETATGLSPASGKTSCASEGLMEVIY